MQYLTSLGRGLCASLLVFGLAACSLPRTGPTTREITREQELPEGLEGFHVVPVTSDIAQITRPDETLTFTADFINAPRLASDVIRSGDTLSVTVWESVDVGLLAGRGRNATPIQAMQVDETGHIFMPYVGRIKAAGRTPDALRVTITESLADRTPDPQVEVRRVAGDGATVSILGAVRKPGIYPIETPTRRLASMLARAGGVGIEPDVAQVKIERRGKIGRVWLQDLYDRPDYNIALRAGDQLVIEQDRRAFTTMGATGRQARVSFVKRDMNVLEAIAASAGLNGFTADPKGVFVFRAEAEPIARRVTGDASLTGAQKMAYMLDLTKPAGVFAARSFVIRDEDTIYVTESPFNIWRQLLGISSSVVSLGGSVATLTN